MDRHLLNIFLLALLFLGIAGNVTAQTDVCRDEACFRSSWLEIPAPISSDDPDIYYVTHRGEMNGTLQRNYSICYDSDAYTSYWVAYPLCPAHFSTGRSEYWGYDTEVPEQEQTSVKTGYGASVKTPNYSRNFYARGHQIPNADRNAVPEMLAQTYFSTNMTPQIQNGFNGGIWSQLEKAVRSAVPQNDTLYIVTGASFSKAGENEKVRTIVNKNDNKTLPVPNYYWKAVLKVIRNADGVPVRGEAIGFWLPHADLKGHSYTEYAVPVDSLESWTGIDFFVNLPDPAETQAESCSSWKTFLQF